jgi:hypothetical protein
MNTRGSRNSRTKKAPPVDDSKTAPATDNNICYQQDTSDCGHWGFRLAFEYLVCKFSLAESDRFNSWPCSRYGSNLKHNLDQFIELFPAQSSHISFQPRQDVYSVRQSRISNVKLAPLDHHLLFVETIQKGGAIIINLRNFDFPSGETSTITPSSKKSGGHTMLCIDVTRDGCYVLLDANKNDSVDQDDIYRDTGNSWPIQSCLKNLPFSYTDFDTSIDSRRPHVNIYDYIVICTT